MSLTGSILLLITAIFDLSIWVIIPAFFLIVSSVGISNTTCFSLGMQRQGKVAGSASAFLGILPYAGGTIVSPLVGLGGEYTSVPLGITILICSLLACGFYASLMKSIRNELN